MASKPTIKPTSKAAIGLVGIGYYPNEAATSSTNLLLDVEALHAQIDNLECKIYDLGRAVKPASASYDNITPNLSKYPTDVRDTDTSPLQEGVQAASGNISILTARIDDIISALRIS